MAFLDDLESRAQAGVDSSVTSVQSWLDTQGADAVIKVGEAALGNQTALQIANGQTGARNPIAPGQNASGNVLPYPTIAGVAMSGPILILLAVGAYFLLKGK